MKPLIFSVVVLFVLLLAFLVTMSGCIPVPPPNFRLPPGEQTANGGLGFLRTLSIVGIGVIVFFACWNSMKIWIAAICGVIATLSLTTMCMYWEKWFALVTFIGLAIGLILTMISLFVKHKGIFLAWKK